MDVSENINLSWVRAQKAEAMSQAYNAGIVKKSRLRIESYENAVLIPLHMHESRLEGGAFDEYGVLIPLSRVNAWWPIGRKNKDYVYIDNTVVYCGGCGGCPFH